MAGWWETLLDPGGVGDGTRLRPPGAGTEREFLAACIKCSRCIEVCPYGSIRPAPFSLGRGSGAPLVVPEVTPCYLCMKCTRVCPTDALCEIEPEETRMGRAAIVTETCLSYADTVCNLCFRECPLKDTAITIDLDYRPVIEEACTGCGVCLNVCPTEPKSIRIRPGRKS